MQKAQHLEPLITAFTARRCDLCDAQADDVRPGSEAIWRKMVIPLADGGTRRYSRIVKRAIPMRCLCRPHSLIACAAKP